MTGRPRAGRIVGLVSALGAAQGTAIITQIGGIGTAVGGSPFGAGPTATLVITLLSSVFLTVALTVTAVVVTGAAEVVVAGEIGVIALRRLLGARSTAERDRVTRWIVLRALSGMGVGVVVGYLVSVAVLAAGLSTSRELRLTAGELVPSPLVLVALAVQLIVTRVAARRGTRGVLDVPPVTALRLSADADDAVPVTLGVSRRASPVLLLCGVGVLGVALVASRITPIAMLPGVVGGVLSFIGVVSVGPRFVPALIGLIGGVFGRSLPMTVGRRALLRHPDRASRAVLAVAAPVTLVTTFAVGIASFDRAVRVHYAGWAAEGAAGEAVSTVVGVVYVLAALLFVTAAVALGNAVSFGAWLRRRETALLRVLGQSARATRVTVRAQSLLLAATAVVVGVVLGIAYGWVGAQCVVGAVAKGHVVAAVIPVPVLLGAVAAVGVLTVVASWAPTRAALRRPPIRAYLAP